MRWKAALLLLMCSSVFGAEFRSGQAARAVFGQSFFSSRDAGVSAISLVVAGDRLYVADESRRTYTFDVSQLADARAKRSSEDGAGCSVCFRDSIAESAHAVMPGVAAVSVWGKTVAIADSAHHRVLVWRDATSPRLDRGPDLVLRAGFVDPVSVALDDRHLFVGDAALHRVLVWNALPVSEDQAPDEMLGRAAASDPSADSIGTPSAMTSNGTDLFVADAAGRRVLVFSPGDRALGGEQILNAASLRPGPVASGTLLAISGNDLAAETVLAAPESDRPLPRELGGVEVVLDGMALPLVSVSPEQVQALVPPEFLSRGAGTLFVRSEHGGTVSVTNAVALKMTAASPGMFALGGTEPRPGLLLHGAANSPVTEEYPARAGETLTVWATGLGNLLEDGTVAVAVSAAVNGEPAPVLSAKLAEHAAGIYEVRIAVPSPGRAHTRAQLVISQNGLASNTVVFPVTSPQ